MANKMRLCTTTRKMFTIRQKEEEEEKGEVGMGRGGREKGKGGTWTKRVH